jgi:hypothetical protein
LKPENIMLVEREGNRDFVKLLDFGVARIDSAQDGRQLTEIGSMLGTPRYMSPEQILGRAVDSRTDLYSLGVILFELLTGQCPFAGNLATLLEQHVTLPPPELPPALVTEQPRIAEILRVLLAKNPENRFQSASELAAAMEEVSRQAGRASDVRAASPAHASSGLLRRAGHFLRDLGRGAPSSMTKLASSTSDVASVAVSTVRDRLARWRRRRRNQALARTADRWMTRNLVAASQIGRQTMKLGRELAASARLAWVRSTDYCGAQWRLHSRAWKLAVVSVAALGLIALLVVMVRGDQAAGNQDASARPDLSGAKHRPSQPAKSSKPQR